jgi:hypothetical protein
MRLADHITINFNNNMSTAAVFLDIEKAFDKTWHSGLLHKLSELAFSTRLIKLVASFLTNRKMEALVEGEFSTPRNIAARRPQGSVLAIILYGLYRNDTPKHVELILPCSRTIPLLTRQRNMNVMFSASYNAASLH